MHSIAIMLIAQSAPATIDFDLGKLPAPRCGGLNSDIVVCARKRTENRIGALPEIEIAPPPKAELKLFGDVKAGLEAEGASVGGFVSNRVMARVKIPL